MLHHLIQVNLRISQPFDHQRAFLQILADVNILEIVVGEIEAQMLNDLFFIDYFNVFPVLNLLFKTLDIGLLLLQVGVQLIALVEVLKSGALDAVLSPDEDLVPPVDVGADGITVGVVSHIVLEPVTLQLETSNVLASNEVPCLQFSTLIQCNELILDDFESQVVCHLVDSNELDAVGMQQGNDGGMTEVAEVADSALLLAVEEGVVATDIEYLEGQGLDLAGAGVAEDVIQIVVEETLFGGFSALAESVGDVLGEVEETLDVLLVYYAQVSVRWLVHIDVMLIYHDDMGGYLVGIFLGEDSMEVGNNVFCIVVIPLAWSILLLEYWVEYLRISLYSHFLIFFNFYARSRTLLFQGNGILSGSLHWLGVFGLPGLWWLHFSIIPFFSLLIFFALSLFIFLLLPLFFLFLFLLFPFSISLTLSFFFILFNCLCLVLSDHILLEVLVPLQQEHDLVFLHSLEHDDI